MNHLTAALEARRSDLRAAYERTVRATSARLSNKFGTKFSDVYNSTDYRTFKNLVESNLSSSESYELDNARIAANADLYASQVIAAWGLKLREKMGELDSAEVYSLDTWSFRVSGRADGRRVNVDQQMIINFSSKGTPFNQWPARVYVDGKAVSAKKWKELRAA